MSEATSFRAYPVLPLRDIVIFPHMIVPLFVGRSSSVAALQEAMRKDRRVLLLTQRDSACDEPTPDDIHTVGCIATVLQLLDLPDGTVKVLVEGGPRVRTTPYMEAQRWLAGEVEAFQELPSDAKELATLSRAVLGRFEQYIKLNKKIPPEVMVSLNQIEGADRLADSLAAHLDLSLADKQALLETPSVARRLETIYAHMEGEIGVLEVEKRIRGRVKQQMERTQRDYFLNEQMKAIQRELGDAEDGGDEASQFAQRLHSTKMPREVREKVESELRKFRNMSPTSAEAGVVRTYLGWLLDLPWAQRARLKTDLAGAQEILDADHFGLEKVKDRIVEYLAVQQRVGKLKGPILCLVGPPGVGKTSLGQSLARATNRKFVRISLGGVRDEAEVRGHRRTYVGAMPGKIIQAMKRAGTVNPLIMLDELDKLGADHRGDPASALLEVLDPAQNNAFADHYLDVPYDLSAVMFIATANTLNMPRPLLDRMEIIRLPGYTEQEKAAIAKRYLIPKQARETGLTDGQWGISEGALTELIRGYTREAGVRNLQREIGGLARKAVRAIEAGTAEQLTITRRNLARYAGLPRYRSAELEAEDKVGTVTGLAWTQVGGELLTIEAVAVPGNGKITATGKLGEVMQESITAADIFVRARAESLGLDAGLMARRNIHVHLPEGAVPKDGPSAGLAMITAIVSCFSGIPVRRDVAMTGEITLRGRVLAIGGLKEKLLAAQRAGIRKVLIPQDNAGELVDLPETLKRGLEIQPVRDVAHALAQALAAPLDPGPVTDSESLDPLPTPVEPGTAPGTIRH
ncbi:endopeptidase La [Rhodovibrio salinarum]|uniref:Lon protease n=1 Tax=Rhodovibrio salinarum TaxID=1087 RepID=A0A934V0I4_9PROT|nr:endopeptidase La [Rhodovibrio salinarum]MBK1697661.1 endopeptidase La [Rhodovibrio salinarum]